MSELKKGVSDWWRHLGRAFLRGLVKLKNVWITGAVLTLGYYILSYASDWVGQTMLQTLGAGVGAGLLLLTVLIMGLTLAIIVVLVVLMAWFWLRDLWNETKEEYDELTDDGG